MGAPARNPELPRQTHPKPPPCTRGKNQPEIADSAVRDLSLVLGGPLYDFLLRFGIVRLALPNVVRRIVGLVALTWLPLLFLSLKDGLAFGNQVKIPFLYDFSIYGRFLIGLPLLLLAEIVIDPAIRQAVGEFLNAGLVPDEERPEFDRVLERTQLLRDSWVPEGTILALAFFPVFLFQHEWAAGAISSWHTTSAGLTAAAMWFAVFSTPVLRFLIYRWVFRYVVWALLLWRISQLHLILPPTHPDPAAGLNFLGLAQKRFGILILCFGMHVFRQYDEQHAIRSSTTNLFPISGAGVYRSVGDPGNTSLAPAGAQIVQGSQSGIARVWQAGSVLHGILRLKVGAPRRTTDRALAGDWRHSIPRRPGKQLRLSRGDDGCAHHQATRLTTRRSDGLAAHPGHHHRNTHS
jgi:hypothetical protein